MSNPGSFPQVGVAFVAQNANEYAFQLDKIAVLYDKLKRQIPDLQSAIRNSNLALDEQARAEKLVTDSFDRAAFTVSQHTKATRLDDDAIKAMTKSLREAAQAQKIAGSSVQTPTTQAEQTDLKKREDDARRLNATLGALGKQRAAEEAAVIRQQQETSLKAYQERAQAEQALSAMFTRTATTYQKQLQETDVLRRKSNQQAYTEAQRIIQSQIQQALSEKNYTEAIRLNALAQQEAAAAGDKVRIAALKTQEARIGAATNATPASSYGKDLGKVLSIAFALNSAIDLLSRSLSGKLTPAAREAADAVRIISDTALFGLSTGGVPGAVVGALAGAIGALGIMALKTDPMVQAFNDTLDKLGKKDDAAQGLAKLAGVSDKNAAAALEYLKANEDLAQSFQVLVQNAQPSIPVLQGIGNALRAAGDARQAFSEALANSIPGYKAYFDFLAAEPALLAQVNAYNATYAQTLRETGSTVLAAAAASKAQQAAVVSAAEAQTKATNDLAKAAQAYADIQNEINNTTNRVAAQSAQEVVDKLRLEGGSADELRLAYIKLAQAKRDAEGVTPSFNGARAYAVSPITSDASGLQQSQANDYSFLNDTATKLAKDLLSVQRQYNDDSARLSSEHSQRIVDIESAAYTQQVRMEREFRQRKQAIQDQYDQDTADAYNDYRERVAQAEASVQERRSEIAQAYSDKRAQIEQDYQDRIAQIQSDYAASLFDIVARDDAKGLVRARLQREKALAEAAKARDKDMANADKDHAKQEKELSDSLEKQKKQLDADYARRQRDLLQAFNKQNESNAQNYRDPLQDLVDATAAQQAAEQAAYTKSQTALDKANADKQQSLIDALVEIKSINDQYGQAIIDSLKSILDPATIIQLTNDLQKAFDTKIEIKVTPNAASGGGGTSSPNTGPVSTPSSYGTPGSTSFITPSSRTSMPLGGRVTASASAGRVNIFIDNAVNSALLNSQIRTEAIGVTAEIIRRGTGY